MKNQLLLKVLDVQHLNATLNGRDLRAAAEGLVREFGTRQVWMKAFDAVGERIIGAAMMVSERPLQTFDYTQAFPPDSTCLLVGGVIAGPVGLASEAAAARAAGAQRIEVAMLSSWADPVEGVNDCHVIGGRPRASVA